MSGSCSRRCSHAASTAWWWRRPRATIVTSHARSRPESRSCSSIDPPPFLDADVVVSDNVGGARTAVSHLIAAGHRRIGFLGDQPEVHTATERLRGYREALAAHAIEQDPQLIARPAFRATDAEESTRRLLSVSEPPTALFTSQNLITLGALRTLHEMGLQHSIALVGFDDVLLADVIEPGVTVVAQDPYRIGREAAELVFSRLDGYAGPSRERVLPTPRSSAAPAASRDARAANVFISVVLSLTRHLRI